MRALPSDGMAQGPLKIQGKILLYKPDSLFPDAAEPLYRRMSAPSEPLFLYRRNNEVSAGMGHNVHTIKVSILVLK